jgi:hypothetical protein
MQVQDKLSTDSHLFDTKQRHIKYVGNCTAREAYDYIWPKLADEDFANAEDIIQALVDIFDEIMSHLRQVG